MSHSITRLIVGEPLRVRIGVRVGQQQAVASSAGTLNWSKGGWVSGDSASAAPIEPQPVPAHEPAAMFAAEPEAPAECEPAAVDAPQQPALRAPAAAPRTPKQVKAKPHRFRPGRRVVWGLCGLATVAVGTAMLLAWKGEELSLPWRTAAAPASLSPPPAPTPAPQPLPIAPPPAPDDGGAVRVVSAPYAPAPELAASSASMPLPPHLAALPERPPARPNGAVIAPPAAAAPAPATQVAAVESAKSKEPASQVKPPAVVLDEAAPVSAPAARPASSVAAAPASKPAASAPKAEPLQAAKPSLARGSGLVAITPDGQSALFTNPKTRLPVQYKLGEQLPGGDSIRTIDYKEGKVVTSTREYSLE